MTITFEAIYESGVLKPLMPLTELKEKQKVQVNVETGSVVDRLLANPIQIDPQIAREIAEWKNGSDLDLESEDIVDRQRRQRLILTTEMMDDVMNSPENDLFEA